MRFNGRRHTQRPEPPRWAAKLDDLQAKANRQSARGLACYVTYGWDTTVLLAQTGVASELR